MLRKLALGLGLSVFAGLLSSPVTMAKTTGASHTHAKQSLVALGDSITYGYDLNTNANGTVNNQHPSKKAFPYLIGHQENMRVRDLGVPGWTSSQLLNALQSNKKYRQAVQHASVITIDIGSNDLLNVLKTASSSDPTALGNALAVAGHNLVASTLPNILQQVHTLNPSARVILYNLYDPWPVQSPIHQLADSLLGTLDTQGISSLAQQSGARYADAYDAFNGKQSQYVLPGNVHPTVAGQAELAELGENALDTSSAP